VDLLLGMCECCEMYTPPWRREATLPDLLKEETTSPKVTELRGGKPSLSNTLCEGEPRGDHAILESGWVNNNNNNDNYNNKR